MKFRHSIYTACMPEFTPEAAVVAIREAGYTGVEWRVFDKAAPKPSGPWFLRDNLCTIDFTEAAAVHAAQLCESQGLAMVGLSPYIDTGDIASVKKSMAMAAASGAPQIRIRAARTDEGPYQGLVKATHDYFSGVAELAARYGVKAVVEMHHNTIGASASATRRLVERFSSEEIGVIMDVGNMAIEGYEDYRVAVATLGPYLTHIHIKNVGWRRSENGKSWSWYWAPLDDGVVDIANLLKALADTGYQGWISQEDFVEREDSLALMRRNRSYLTQLEEGHGQ